MFSRQFRLGLISAPALMGLALSACGSEVEPEVTESVVATDPLMARALNDPLMVDPDLAYRNEANAALTVRYDHALPPLVATDELANQAREAARVELLADGQIPPLPFPSSEGGAGDLSNLTTADAIFNAVGGPQECASALEAGLNWSVDMPGPSSIMPHGMVQQAAGVASGNCNARIVRYVTPVDIDDALGYHFARADRARLRPAIYEAPEKSVVGDGRTEHLVAHVREGPGGMTAVDLIYWTK
ncbi:hypothetical protein [Erythrobacter crassostreae]|uniref:SCP domain-containing protein n=1 Tax=Erythrobacter crassostreae TaxID=2828328 RepID=A0A9X1JPM1_9SPHN|nr:hypothetical protein [Erythrobacter crassostrea]MBV7259567.1 hypothetical protein [Erythrobacter crassostrea]